MRCLACQEILGRKTIDPKLELCNKCLSYIRDDIPSLSPSMTEDLIEDTNLEGDYDE